jgi:hypothetical protein
VLLRASDNYVTMGAGSRHSPAAKDVDPKSRFVKCLEERDATKAAKKPEAATKPTVAAG